MTDWTTGQLADAHRVVGLLRSSFQSKAKTRIRQRALVFLSRWEPELVLDAWGGGQSASDAVAVGLSVLSVDDGRFFAAHGVSKARGFRAMSISGKERGYRTEESSLEKYAAECDAAFLDFCGFWSLEAERTVRACSGMKAIVVTLMADRLAIGSNLSKASWVIAYRALLESHSGMRVFWHERYLRESGQTAICFALAPGSNSRVIVCQRDGCEEPVGGSAKSRYCSYYCKRKYQYDTRDGLGRSSRWRLEHVEEVRCRQNEANHRRTAHIHVPRKCAACHCMFTPARRVNIYCQKPKCRRARDVVIYQRNNRRNSERKLQALEGTRRTCPICSDSFQPDRANQRLCFNPECHRLRHLQSTHRYQARHRELPHDRLCLVCSTPFAPRNITQVICGKTECHRVRLLESQVRYRARDRERRREATTLTVAT